ncbi:hypothetical protein PspLS_04224 [Pyricularia sp. CBS 133598]|nr:hypothetical protein PspLS_04224 [Pyricularia sp. CBS 133598]
MENPYSLAPRGCATCGKATGLLFCAGCRVVHYCGRTHQEDHRPTHKAACNAIKKTNMALEKEEAILRSVMADVFDTQVGHFWGIVETRDYMMTRFTAARALLKVNNIDAVEEALNHFKDMLRLCRSDNLGVRDIVPFLYLRLDQEQECYDFLKSWTIDGPDGRRPNTSIRNANPFESLYNLISISEPAHLVALTLLKLRLYLDLDAYQSNNEEINLSALGLGRPPSPDGFDRPFGKLVKARVRSMPSDRIYAEVQDLKSQYLKLCQAVHNANPYIWPRLVNQDTVPTPPDMYSPGSPEEADLVVFTCKRAWDESEDSIVMIDADTARFTTVYRGLGTAAGVSVQDTSHRDVLVLCVENKSMIEQICKPLIARITAKASSVQMAGTVDEAFSKLNQTPPPSVILVADGAITRQRKLLERVIDLLHCGATVVLAGYFSSSVSSGELERTLATIGLPWTMGSYTRETVKLRRRAVPGEVVGRLPSAYSQKTLFLSNVGEPDAWYGRDDNHREAAVAFTKVGHGKLGYVGDVNGEDESDTVIMAMCGL